MRVKCIALIPNEEQAELLGIGKYYYPDMMEFDVIIGEEYVVYSLTFLDGVPWVELATVSGYLHAVPLCLFEIIDGRVSKVLGTES